MGNIPTYLFRLFGPTTAGRTTEFEVTSPAWVYPQEHLISRMSLFERHPDDARRLIYDHLRWGDKEHEATCNLMSWTSSLLFAIQYGIYRSSHANHGHAQVPTQDLQILVVNTQLFPPGAFIRDLDLIDAFPPLTPEQIELRNWRTRSRRRHDDVVRVNVPDMPSWIGNIQHSSLTNMADEHHIATYYMDPKDESRLNWVPFPAKVMHVDLTEKLEPLHTNARDFITIPDKITRSGDLLWKEYGLRILDCDPDCDEEILPNLTPGNLVENQPSVHSEKRFDLREQGLHQNSHSSLVSTADNTAEFPINVQEGSPATPLAKVKGAQGPTMDSDNLVIIKSDVDTRPLKRPRLDISSGKGIALHKTQVARLEGPPASFSASNSLASFLDLRGKRFRKPALGERAQVTASNTISGFQETSEDPIESSQHCVTALRTGLLTDLTPTQFVEGKTAAFERSPRQHLAQSSPAVQVPSIPEASNILLPSPTPTADAITSPCVILLDESLIHNRPLMALLDRNSDSPLQTIYRPLGNTVDIILNPTTALVLTNLQALNQKSLPGQVSPSSRTLLDRIRASVTHYETIYVLVSLSYSQASLGPTTAFAAFCATLSSATDTTICPIWIPASSLPSPPARHPPLAPSLSRTHPDPSMAWTWHLITHHSLHMTSEMSFIDDTTLWELFLGKAGVNALAAQAVLGMLKRDGLPETDGGSVGREMIGSVKKSNFGTEGLWGLRKLVAMGREERTRRFGPMLGRKALGRLKTALEDGKES